MRKLRLDGRSGFLPLSHHPRAKDQTSSGHRVRLSPLSFSFFSPFSPFYGRFKLGREGKPRPFPLSSRLGDFFFFFFSETVIHGHAGNGREEFPSPSPWR